jgi:hypothetical protein
LNHAPKFEHGEFFARETNTPLAVENGSTGLEEYREADEQEYWATDYEQHHCEHSFVDGL